MRNRSMARHVCALVSAFALSAAAHASIWFGDQKGVHQIDTAANAVVTDVAQEQVGAMVVDPRDQALWVVTAGRVLKYSPAGAVLAQFDLKGAGSGLGSGRWIALSSADGSVWVAADRTVIHLSANATWLASFPTAEPVRDIAVAPDQTLWVLGQTSLQQFSTQSALGTAPLDAAAQPTLAFAIDDASGLAWVAGGSGYKRLEQVDLRNPSQPLSASTTDEAIVALAVAPDTRALWVLGKSTLRSFAPTGVGGAATSLKSLNNPFAISYDQTSQSLWVGHSGGISRFTSAGQYVLTLPASSFANAISRSPGGIVPTLVLVQPSNGGLLRDASPPVTLQYGADCFGQPCGYPPASFATYRLDATLNGAAIGNQFAFDPNTARATYSPPSRLPEGTNVLRAQLTDPDGHTSLPLQASFTIDTVAPRFVTVQPPSGASFNTPAVTVTGSVDDPQAIVTFSGSSATQPQNFSFQANLNPGPNSFALTAFDTAGNQATLPLSYSYVPPNAPPKATLTSPADGAVYFAPATIALSATASDTDGTIAKVEFLRGSTVIGTSTGAPYVFTWSGVPAGTYALSARATDNQGATATSTGVTVTVKSAPLTITSPANGSTVAGDAVLVTGTFSGPANTGVVVNRTVALTDPSGKFSAIVPVAAGTNTLSATMTTPDGQKATQSVTVSADGVQPDVQISSDTNGGLAPLPVHFTVVNGGATAVDVAFNGSVIQNLPPGATGTLSITYTQAFSYPVTITATDTQGHNTAKSFVIVVSSLSQTDQMLKAIWSNITSNLAAGNVEGALAYFAPGTRAKYRKVLNDIAPGLAGMFTGFPAITPTRIGNGDAEYFLVLPRGGVNYGYYIYFTQGPDGVWRLEAI